MFGIGGPEIVILFLLVSILVASMLLRVIRRTRQRAEKPPEDEGW